MTETRYAVHPGFVRAKDGDQHYIGFAKLCSLYGVDPRRAFNMGHPAHAVAARYSDVVHLHPRADGNYRRIG